MSISTQEVTGTIPPTTSQEKWRCLIAATTPFRHALVVGSSGGIGEALTQRLQDRGTADHVSTLSRRRDGLDLTSEVAIDSVLSNQNLRPLDLVVITTGILAAEGRGPEKRFRDLSQDALMEAFSVNAAGPALLLSKLLPDLSRRGRLVVVALSARLGSIGDNHLGGWMSYRASKAALNQLWRCAAWELGRWNPDSVCFTYHPGTVDTPLARPHARGRFTFDAHTAADRLVTVLEQATPRIHGHAVDYQGETIPW